jgi:hypothetical protein
LQGYKDSKCGGSFLNLSGRHKPQALAASSNFVLLADHTLSKAFPSLWLLISATDFLFPLDCILPIPCFLACVSMLVLKELHTIRSGLSLAKSSNLINFV